MLEDPLVHVGLAAYLLGSLAPDERAGFEQHMAECTTCQEEESGLRSAAGLLLDEPMPGPLPAALPPPGLRLRVIDAVERAAAGEPGAEPARPAAPPATTPRRRVARRHLGLRIAASIGMAAAIAVGVVAGTRLDGDEEPAGGPTEVAAVLTSRGGDARGTAEIVKTGIGRVISFDTRDLPILPKGDYYELWFVGPGDTLARPNRISAGTFHPDEQGRSSVTFAAAVDPAKYPGLSVTSEPGDGNPQRTGPEVLRAQTRRP